ncbi:hypothetical protein KC330_g3495 [Hortaea werneckii]|nr:hypothetical protein KC330_g3495 [Hortaea werneckii]
MIPLHQRPEDADYNKNYFLYWNHVALELVRLTHTETASGAVNGPPLVARMLAILHLAIHDAFLALHNTAGIGTYLSPTQSAPYRLADILDARDGKQAVAGAAITVLEDQYFVSHPSKSFNANDQVEQLLRQYITTVAPDTLSSSYRFGYEVGKVMLKLLAIKQDEPRTKQDGYMPRQGQYRFFHDPTKPVVVSPVDPNDPDSPKRASRRIGNDQTEHMIADPLVGFGEGDVAEYVDALRDVYRMGGRTELNTTTRRPWQTAAAHFWAYDGSNLIGVPLRLSNQILRKVAWDYRPDKKTPDSDKNNVEFARLFALCNAAMADAGIFAWQEQCCFEFWRPLSGVREASTNLIVRNRGNGMVEGIPDPDRPPTMDDGTVALQDPFWLELGALSTNSNRIPFKPAFPAYPSGHATFGAACFQMMRLYYKNSNREGIADFDVDGPDNIAFDFVSDEQDGRNRDNLRHAFDPTVPIEDQPGIVRAAWKRRSSSLWEAMWENAVSRVWLGVHWRFDAFSPQDTLIPNGNPSTTTTKTSTGSRRDRPGKNFPIGGVPLGIGIANDIFQGGLRPTSSNRQPTGRHKCGRL